MRVNFVQRRELAPFIWQYDFRPEGSYSYIAGQYADFHFVKPLRHDPRGQSRTFTLTSLPGDNLLSFVVKFPSPCSPYKQALQQLQPGDEMRVNEALGDLVLPKLSSVPLVFMAGGIGMASFAGMLQQLLQAKEERPIYFFYMLRSRTDQIFRELTDAYPLQLKQIILAPNKLHAQEVLDSVPPNSLLYISGTQRYTEALRDEFEQLGTPRSSIVFDYYDGYAEL